MEGHRETGASQPAAPIGDGSIEHGADGMPFRDLPLASLTVEQFARALAMHAALVNPHPVGNLDNQASEDAWRILRFAERDSRFRSLDSSDGEIEWMIDHATGRSVPVQAKRDATLSERRE